MRKCFWQSGKASVERGELEACLGDQRKRQQQQRAEERVDLEEATLSGGFPSGSAVRELACRAGDTGDTGSVSGSGRPPGGGNGNPVQHSCLEDRLDRGAWRVAVHAATSVGHDLATRPPPPVCQGGSKMPIDSQRAALVICSFSVSAHFVKLVSDER